VSRREELPVVALLSGLTFGVVALWGSWFRLSLRLMGAFGPMQGGPDR
jgi:hypothetical protein